MATSPSADTAAAATAVRIDDPSNTKPILLTLPASDLPAGDGDGGRKSSSGTKPTTTDGAQDDDHDGATEQLLLVQLPARSDVTVEDLLSGRAYIVGPGPADDDDDAELVGDDDAAGSSAAVANQACLVIEGTGCNDDDVARSHDGMSYALSKVETSNALVMIPPQKPIIASFNNDNEATTEEDGDESPPKKQRTDAATGTVAKVELEMHAQLLEPGGSGASFLDLRPHLLNMGTLRRLLQRTVYDPYDNTSSSGDGSNGRSAGGMTIAQLASALRVSQSQVRHAMTSPSGLLSNEAFQLPPRNSGRWGMLSEEAREDASMGIVSVLAECEEFANIFTADSKVSKGVNIDDFVKEVVRRSAEAEGDGAACLDAVVVEHCLRCCSSTDNDDDAPADTAMLKLDLDKIALILAHHLFNRQTTPWLLKNFEAEWQRLMPCVGEQSKPSIEVLAGVALQRTMDQLSPAVIRALADKTNGSKDEGSDGGGKGQDEDVEVANDIYLSYLPEYRLPTSPDKRFDLLFREKESWTSTEIEPYVKRLVDEAGSTMEVVLMKYTLSADQNGMKIYRKR